MANKPLSDLDRLLDDAVAPGPCPDDNELAALAEGRVTERERSRLVDHLLRCEACRDVSRALMGAVPSARPPATILAFPRVVIGVAAALFVAIGAFLYVASHARSRGDPSESSSVSLASAGERLARDFPREFGEFRPLDRAELAVRGADPLRGDAGDLLPAGRTVPTRPTFAWAAIAGARSYVVTVLDAAGTRWTRTTPETTLAWPADAAPLERGSRAVWTLAADDPHATHAERAISVVTDDEARAWAEAVAAAESVSEPLRSLLFAHAALRRGLASEAFAAARRFVNARPGDELGEATLAAARDRLAPH